MGFGGESRGAEVDKGYGTGSLVPTTPVGIVGTGGDAVDVVVERWTPNLVNETNGFSCETE